MLPGRSYILVQRDQYLKWVFALNLCWEVLVGLKEVEYHSQIIQNPPDGLTLKVVCSFEEFGITLKTNECNSSVTINLTQVVVKRLLEGFTILFLPPLCSTSIIGLKIFSFVNFYANNFFDLENENLVWEALQKIYVDESEDFYPDIAMNIRLTKAEIFAASKALIFLNQYKSV